MPHTESDYDRAFATAMRDREDFRNFVLGHTKFGDFQARVMADEQAAARKAKHWWKHWWCRVPELEKDSETDVFLVFERADSLERFALHVENKMGNGSFTQNQAESYAVRAKHMMRMHERLFGYIDFDTMLIAPQSFQERHKEQAELFGAYLSYEEIGHYIPDFLLHQ